MDTIVRTHKLGVTFKKDVEIREYDLSHEERVVKRKTNRRGAILRHQYVHQMRLGIMEDDPKKMTGIFANDKAWHELRAQLPQRKRRNIQQVNAEWNAFYREKK